MPRRQQIVSEAAREVLAKAKIEGDQVKLQSGVLERRLYREVDQVLTRLGGQWEGGAIAAHVFYAADMQAVQEALDLVIHIGQMPASPSRFPVDPRTEGSVQSHKRSQSGEEDTVVRSQQEIRMVLEAYRRRGGYSGT